MTRGLYRYRYLFLTVVGAVTLIHVNASTAASDWPLLAAAGRTFLGHEALHTFTTYPTVQIGPLSLPVFGLLSHAQTIACLLALVLAAVTIRIAEQTVLTLRPQDSQRVKMAVLVGGSVVMVAVGDAVGIWGHVEDVVAMTLIVGAVCLLARSANTLFVGTTLGLAVAFKPWAVVAVGVLFAVPSWRRRFGALAVFLAAALIWWLPFVVADPATVHAVMSYQPRIRSGSLMLLGFHLGAHAPHWWRTVEILAGVIVGVAAACRGRVWAVPLAGLAVRVGVESGTFSYYGLGPVFAALLWDLRSCRPVPTWTLGTAAALYLPVELSLPSATMMTVRGAWALTVLVALLRPTSRSARPGEVVDPLRGAEDRHSDQRRRLVEPVGDAALRHPVDVTGDRARSERRLDRVASREGE